MIKTRRRNPGEMYVKGGAAELPAEIAEVLDQFDLGEIVSLVGLRSRTNLNLLLTTSDGRYVLRSSPPSRSLASVAFEHRLLCYLAEQGFPAIAPILSRQTTTWLILNDQLWTLCEFFDGEPLDRTLPEHVTEAARCLAAYHRAVRGFDAGDHQRAGKTDIIEWLQSSAESPICVYPAEQSDVEEARGYLVESWHSLNESVASTGITGLPRVIIHGDFSRRNMLFQDNTLVAVLDFDGCHLEIRPMDVAIALKNVCRGPEKHAQVDMSRVSAFMKAYKSTDQLSEIELTAIPLMLQAHRLRSLVARYERLQFTKRPKGPKAEKLLAEVERYRWLTDYRGEIEDALRG